MATRRSPDVVNPTEPAPVSESSTLRRPAARARKPVIPTLPPAQLTPEARRALIAETAYLRAERRGFTPGQETDDWLAAEAEVDALLRAEQSSQQ